MKAEQRKELETNTLADRMGQVVQKVKGGTRKTALIYAGIAAALIVAAWLGIRWYQTDRLERSERWFKLHDGSAAYLQDLMGQDDEVGKSARFQAAWLLYWERGVKSLGKDQQSALASLREAEKIYEKLAEQCKDDPMFEPQARLGRAVCWEALTVHNRDNLKTAEKHYNELITVSDGKYKESAEGKFAQERLKIIQDPKTSVDYEKLQRMLGIIQFREDMLPKDHPPIKEK